MKRILLVLGLFSFINLYSQTDCKNYVSTDPTNASNNALPSINSNRYLNNFNWLPIVGGQYDDYQMTNMNFAGVNLVEMASVMWPAYQHYKYITDGPEPLVENGWELLLVNLGRFPDDTTPITVGNNLNSKPFIVLYNRYSGTVRIFVNYGLDTGVADGANDMVITLSYVVEDELAGNLRLYEGKDQALNEYTNIVKVSTIVLAPAESRNWASADFKIAYDPCVCYKPSKLRFDFNQIKTSFVELHGREISLDGESLIESNLDTDLTKFLNGFDFNGNDLEKGGVVMHKAIKGMIDDYYVKYKKHANDLVANNEHNKKVKRNLAILRMGKFVVGAVHTAANSSYALPTIAATTILANQTAISEGWDDPAWAQEMFGDVVNPSSNVDWFQAVKDLGNGIVKADEYGNDIIDDKDLFKYIKQILGEKGETFIASNFEYKKSKPPTTPVATFSEMHYVGEYTTNLVNQGFNFFTPGTYGSTGTPLGTTVPFAYDYPVYNEALGTFALLKKPKIKILRKVTDVENEILQSSNTPASISSYGVIEMQRYQSWTNEYQISLLHDLEYALNDVLDIKEYTIQAAFNIKGKIVNNSPSTIANAKVNLFHDHNKNINIESNNTDMAIYDQLVGWDKSYNYFQNHFDANVFSGNYGPVLDSNVSIVSMQTPYLPIENFKPFVAGFGLKNEIITHKTHSYQSFDIDDYPYSLPPSYPTPTGGISVDYDLTNPLIIKPTIQSVINSGYKYDFEIELKLIVDIEFNTLNSDGHNNKTSEVLTYKISPSDINWATTGYLSNLANSSKNITQYSENSFFSTTHFSGQEVNNCKKSGNIYTCKAYNDITISGDITVGNGYKVYFKAGNEINVTNESNISKESVLMIEKVLDDSHPMPKATQSEVTSFCNGQGDSPYLANTPSARVMAIIAAKEKELKAKIERENNSEIQFDMFPNPTINTTTIVINNLRTDKINIQLKDIMGKIIPFDFEQTNSNSYNLDVSHLEGGIYFVTVSSYGVQKTKRLVVQ